MSTGEFIFATAGWLLALAGVLLAWIQLRATHRHTRQDRTLHIDSSVDSLNMTRLDIESALPRTLESISIEDVRAAVAATGDEELERKLRSLLARLQIFSLSVLAGVADEDFAFELLGSTIAWYGRAFTPYVEAVRTANNQPLLYGDLIELARRWQARMDLEVKEYRLNTRPFFGRSRLQRLLFRRRLQRLYTNTGVER